jgi:hypothetical protein
VTCLIRKCNIICIQGQYHFHRSNIPFDISLLFIRMLFHTLGLLLYVFKTLSARYYIRVPMVCDCSKAKHCFFFCRNEGTWPVSERRYYNSSGSSFRSTMRLFVYFEELTCHLTMAPDIRSFLLNPQRCAPASTAPSFPPPPHHNAPCLASPQLLCR